MKLILLFTLINISTLSSTDISAYDAPSPNTTFTAKTFAFGIGHNYGIMGAKVLFISRHSHASYGIGFGLLGFTPQFQYRLNKRKHSSLYIDLGTMVGAPGRKVYVSPFLGVGIQHWPYSKFPKDSYRSFGLIFFPDPGLGLPVSFKGIGMYITIGLGFGT